MGLIYKITNPFNEKVYIGQTKRELETRRNEHFYAALKELYDTVLYRAFKKYGVENFVFGIVEDDIVDDQLDEREIYYIKLYDAIAPHGYNSIEGGVKVGTQAMGEANKKSVYKIDKKTYLIVDEADSITEMAKRYGETSMKISHSCNKQNLTQGDYIYRFKNDYDIEEVEDFILSRRGREVVCHLEGSEESLTFASGYKAAQHYGVGDGNIWLNCNMKKKHSGYVGNVKLFCEYVDKKYVIKEEISAASTQLLAKHKENLRQIKEKQRLKLLKKFSD